MGDQPQEHARRERDCLHRQTGCAGAFYSGAQFVSALQHLRGEAGLRMARKVQPFFWADAPLLNIWLCAECSTEAGLGVQERERDAA